MLNESLTTDNKSGSDRLYVRIVTQSDQTTRATLTHLDNDNAILRLGSANDLRLAMSQRVTLQFDSTRLSTPVEILAHVVHRQRDESSEVCTFRLADQVSHVDRLIREALSSIYNRRATYRVTPDETLQVELRHSALPDAQRVELESLSIGGLGVCVPCDVEADFAQLDTLAVRLELPDGARPLELDCGIVNRRLTNAQHVVYGLEVDATSLDACERGAERIVGYVMNRQQRLLRMACA